jgi:hypothetical protein
MMCRRYIHVCLMMVVVVVVVVAQYTPLPVFAAKKKDQNIAASEPSVTETNAVSSVTQDTKTSPSPEPIGATNPDYEVDYEGDVVDPSVAKKTNRGSNGKAFEGSQAGDRGDFMQVPGPLKSKYKKNGVPLDVDTD